jgi:hypothetical protein
MPEYRNDTPGEPRVGPHEPGFFVRWEPATRWQRHKELHWSAKKLARYPVKLVKKRIPDSNGFMRMLATVYPLSRITELANMRNPWSP